MYIICFQFYVTSLVMNQVNSSHVMSRHVMSRHVTSCHVHHSMAMSQYLLIPFLGE